MKNTSLLWGSVIFFMVVFLGLSNNINFLTSVYIAAFASMWTLAVMSPIQNKLEKHWNESGRNMNQLIQDFVDNNVPQRLMTPVVSPVPDVNSHKAEKHEHVCQVCLTNAVNIVIDPCGHVMCCDCMKKLSIRQTTCPFCRESVNKSIRLYLKKEDLEIE